MSGHPAHHLPPTAIWGDHSWAASMSYTMFEGNSAGDSVYGKPSVVDRFFTRVGQIYQYWLDSSTPYTVI